MKYLKMLGLAAVAAMALMAFVGAGSASATVICKTEVTPCPSGWMVSQGEEVSASLEGTAKLETTAAEPTVLDTCTAGSVSGPTEQTGSATETVSIKFTKEQLSWGSPTSCTNTTDTVSGGTIEFHWISPWSMTVTVKEAKVTVNTLGTSCTYGFGSEYKDIGIINPPKEGGPAKMVISTLVPKTEGNFLCPGEARWTATYKVTTNGGNLWGTES
jgi:hypothetical protein